MNIFIKFQYADTDTCYSKIVQCSRSTCFFLPFGQSLYYQTWDNIHWKLSLFLIPFHQMQTTDIQGWGLRICRFTPRANRYTETQKSKRIRYSSLGKLLSFSAEFYALLIVLELEEGIFKEYSKSKRMQDMGGGGLHKYDHAIHSLLH